MIINGIFKPGDNVLLFDNYEYMFDRNRSDWDEHPCKRRIPELYNNIFAKVVDISYMTYKATLMLPLKTIKKDGTEECLILKYIDVDMLYEINTKSIWNFRPKPLFYNENSSYVIDKRIFDRYHISPSSTHNDVVFYSDIYNREMTLLNYINIGFGSQLPVTALNIVTREFYERYYRSYAFEVFDLYSDLCIVPRESIDHDIITMRYKHNQEVIGNNLTRVNKGEDIMEKKLTVTHKDLRKIDKTNNKRYDCDKTKIQIEYDGGLIVGEAIYTHNSKNPNEYSERQGVLEAIANAVCDGDFDKFFRDYLRTKKKEERELCRCPKCGILYNSIEDKDNCVAWHKSVKSRHTLAYKGRKKARWEEELRIIDMEKDKFSSKAKAELNVKKPVNPNPKPKKTKKTSSEE